MYIRKNEKQLVALDSAEGKKLHKAHLKALADAEAASKAKREAERLEKQSIALAEAEALIREAADEAGVDIIEFLKEDKPKAKRQVKPKAE